MFSIILLCSKEDAAHLDVFCSNLGGRLRDATGKALEVPLDNCTFMIFPYAAADNASRFQLWGDDPYDPKGRLTAWRQSLVRAWADFVQEVKRMWGADFSGRLEVKLTAQPGQTLWGIFTISS